MVRHTFPDFVLNLIGMGGLGIASTSTPEPICAVGESSTLLFLLRGVILFLIFGVRGEPVALAVTFEPLAVFFSSQITFSYCGDDEAFRGRFLAIGDSIGGCEQSSKMVRLAKIRSTDNTSWSHDRFPIM